MVEKLSKSRGTFSAFGIVFWVLSLSRPPCVAYPRVLRSILYHLISFRHSPAQYPGWNNGKELTGVWRITSLLSNFTLATRSWLVTFYPASIIFTLPLQLLLVLESDRIKTQDRTFDPICGLDLLWKMRMVIFSSRITSLIRIRPSDEYFERSVEKSPADWVWQAYGKWLSKSTIGALLRTYMYLDLYHDVKQQRSLCLQFCSISLLQYFTELKSDDVTNDDNFNFVIWGADESQWHSSSISKLSFIFLLKRIQGCVSMMTEKLNNGRNRTLSLTGQRRTGFSFLKFNSVVWWHEHASTSLWSSSLAYFA